VALALLEAGDLTGSEEVQEGWGKDAKVEKGIASRWNSAFEREQEALRRWRTGMKAFVNGDREAAFADLDPALAYFAKVRRPHFPASRDELYAHLAGDALAAPVQQPDVESARAWLERAGKAPEAERALVRAALSSLGGDAKEASSQLEAAGSASPTPAFEALRLETRARLAASAGDAAEAKAVSEAAAARLAANPGEAVAERLRRLTGDAR
jgi:hypothetical protein